MKPLTIKYIEDRHATKIPHSNYIILKRRFNQLDSNDLMKPLNDDITLLKSELPKLVDTIFSYDGYHSYLLLSGKRYYLNIFIHGGKLIYTIYNSDMTVVETNYLTCLCDLLDSFNNILKQN